MPYISPSRRLRNEPWIPRNPKEDTGIITVGDLSYSIHQRIHEYIAVSGGPSYTTYNDVVGVLECTKMELYRRLVGPYEATKIKENGDVLPYAEYAR